MDQAQSSEVSEPERNLGNNKAKEILLQAFCHIKEKCVAQVMIMRLETLYKALTSLSNPR